MAMKGIIIYQSHFELISQLSNEQAGELIKAIGLFGLGKEPTITDSLVLGIWMSIRRDFVIQAENYEKKVEVNRKNGKSGGRPKTQPVISETQANPQNLKDKDKDKDKDIDKDYSNYQVSIAAVNAPDFEKDFREIETILNK